jgi:hypothetical protein
MLMVRFERGLQRGASFVPSDRVLSSTYTGQPLAFDSTSSREQINRSDACLKIGDVIVQEDGMSDGHGPQSGVGNVRPMDRGLKPHCSRNAHCCLYGPFTYTVVMMSTSTCESDDLGEFTKLASVTR